MKKIFEVLEAGVIIGLIIKVFKLERRCKKERKMYSEEYLYLSDMENTIWKEVRDTDEQIWKLEDRFDNIWTNDERYWTKLDELDNKVTAMKEIVDDLSDSSNIEKYYNLVGELHKMRSEVDRIYATRKRFDFTMVPEESQ